MFDNLFIFEMANNHQGSVSHGLEIIDAMAEIARKHNIHAAVKFQFRDLDTLIHPYYREARNVPHIPRFIATRLEDADYRRMIDAVRSAGMIAIATPFDEPSVQACIERGIGIIKVASCSATDWPLLEVIAQTGRPVIASTGGLDMADVDRLESYLRHNVKDYALLHCIATYPAVDANLGFMRRMMARYPGVTIGYSGHEAPDNTDVVKCAVSIGAKILERHVGIPSQYAGLNAYSMDPAQTDAWVQAALTARALCAYGARDEAEAASLETLQRGVYAKRPIRKGQTIRRDDVYFAMPYQVLQLTAGQFGSYRAAYTASVDYEPHEPILEPVLDDPVTQTRTIIHVVRGLLNEAGIVAAGAVELSHHYGLDEFCSIGATIVNVINEPEYCKKLVILLPCQSHPNHKHIRKQETFQLLWGDMRITINGQTTEMAPGDCVTVRRGDWHEFVSAGGAVIEEVSTHHYTGDSVYEDPEIARLDPVQRKTMVEF